MKTVPSSDLTIKKHPNFDNTEFTLTGIQVQQAESVEEAIAQAGGESNFLDVWNSWYGRAAKNVAYTIIRQATKEDDLNVVKENALKAILNYSPNVRDAVSAKDKVKAFDELRKLTESGRMPTPEELLRLLAASQ